MTTLGELRAALAGLTALGVPSELARFEEELAVTPLPEVEALADRYRDYVQRNSTPEAVHALTMTYAESADVLRRRLAGSRS
jgi:hypothetical protein